jgi:uncharacterized protein (DUF1786 family)
MLEALRLLGETAPIDGVALAVQDHGLAPSGESDRNFRIGKMSAALELPEGLGALFYRRKDIPDCFTRMRAAADLVPGELPLVCGDTGPAALWGASLACRAGRCLAINFGNGHTLMSFVEGDRADGLFEHHTSMLDAAKMESYIRRFFAGELTSTEVFDDGGHGVIQPSRPYDLATTEIVVTGPRRGDFSAIDLPLVEAHLYGDMMLTGCYGALLGYMARRG